jgi:hypothetical protein
MGFLMLFMHLSRVSYQLAILTTLGAFILGWVGFSVPDWMSFSPKLNVENKFGLWSYCIHSFSIGMVFEDLILCILKIMYSF